MPNVMRFSTGDGDFWKTTELFAVLEEGDYLKSTQLTARTFGSQRTKAAACLRSNRGGKFC